MSEKTIDEIITEKAEEAARKYYESFDREILKKRLDLIKDFCEKEIKIYGNGIFKDDNYNKGRRYAYEEILNIIKYGDPFKPYYDK